MASGDLFVTVHVDTTQAQQQLRLLRWALWFNGLWPRFRRWLARRVPILCNEVFRLQRERDEARALAAELHLRYWSLMALRHPAQISVKN